MSDNKNTSNSLASWWPMTKHFIAGSASGVALVLAGHAFDTVKVRLQTEQTGKFKGPIHCLLITVREEGIRGLYKGATPPMVATGFINSVLFGLMGMCKSRIQTDPTKSPTIGQVMACGTITGVMISVIVTPIEHVKAKLQVQYAQPAGSKPDFKGPIDCASKIIASKGILGLWTGWVATVFHRGSNWAYFGGYEVVKRFLAPDNGKLSPLAAITAGACAGTSFWLSCYPVDVIKNRMQAASIKGPPKYKGFIHCARTIYLEGGPKAFFKGFTPCLLRSVPANSAAFFAFEVVYHMLP